MPHGQQRANEYADVLQGVRRVAAEAARRAAEIDEMRSFPQDLFDELEATGVFKSLTPKAYGGLELSLGQANHLIVEGARANGSLGWLLMIGLSQGIGLGMFPEKTVAKLLEEFSDLRTRGVFAPKGTAVPTDGGYVVTGQWPFASGGPNPHFVGGNCIVMRDGKPSILPDGAPELVIAMMPASAVEPLDTWHVLGMRGSDSHDYAAREVFVPEEMTINIVTAASFFDTPPARLPIRVALATQHCAVALGLAQGALDELTELAKTKKAAMNPSAVLAADPVFRHTLGEQTLRFTGVMAMLDQVTAELERAGAEEREFTPEETLIGRTMAAYITAECVKIVDVAYTYAGSTSVYNTSSLQRRLRDIHVATQHVAATPEGYRVLGAALVGEKLSPTELF
ncbi:acyl-CoA dehydrogenase family protein [Pseudofrankia sp. BMG5.36]|uniref:acyl-CoA dehydrogenase family protein n=1 Tax=Pseudofrankia sp. BMG5.36 TaxID=1834512 RepID=UPI0018E37B7E|nr:acyl-CoA dehydrogenase family protein [Pseudofrankia sp. BMG5.36]